MKCPECDGTGIFLDEPGPCYFCMGSGRLEECDSCNGRGYFSGDNGIFGEQDADCGTCDGKGSIPILR